MAKVDVVIPNYQYGRYLGRCLDSVLGQSLHDIRVLVVDNASTDDSVEVAKAAMAQDRRVSLLTHSRNVGQIASINEGIDWISSDYFLVLCSDDILSDGALSRAAAVMDRNRDIAFCMGDFEHFTESHVPCPPTGASESDASSCRIYSGAQYLHALCQSPLTSTGNFLITRTDIQKKVGYYRSNLLHCCDLELVLRLCEFGYFAQLDAVQGFRRLHAGNIANAYRDSKLARLKAVSAAFESFFANEGRLNRDAEGLSWTVRHRLASYGYWSAAAHLISGQPKAAGDLFQFAFEQSPRCRVLPPVGQLLSLRLLDRVRLALTEAVAARSASWSATRQTQTNL